MPDDSLPAALAIAVRAAVARRLLGLAHQDPVAGMESRVRSQAVPAAQVIRRHVELQGDGSDGVALLDLVLETPAVHRHCRVDRLVVLTRPVPLLAVVGDQSLPRVEDRAGQVVPALQIGHGGAVARGDRLQCVATADAVDDLLSRLERRVPARGGQRDLRRALGDRDVQHHAPTQPLAHVSRVGVEQGAHRDAMLVCDEREGLPRVHLVQRPGDPLLLGQCLQLRHHVVLRPLGDAQRVGGRIRRLHQSAELGVEGADGLERGPGGVGDDLQVGGLVDGHRVPLQLGVEVDEEAVVLGGLVDQDRREDGGDVPLGLGADVARLGQRPVIPGVRAGQGAVDFPLSRVVGRHRQVPVAVAVVQLLEVSRRGARRLLEVAALIDPQVHFQSVLAAGEGHELPDPLGAGAREGVHLERRLLVRHVGQVLRQPRLMEDLLDHRQVAARALQARLEFVPQARLERLDVGEDPRVQHDRDVVGDLADHLLDLLTLLLGLLRRQVGRDVLQIIERRAILLLDRLVLPAVQVGVHVGDVPHDLVERLLERRLLVQIDVAGEHDVDGPVELALRLVEAPGLVGLQAGLVGLLHLIADLAHMGRNRLAPRPVRRGLSRHDRHHGPRLVAAQGRRRRGWYFSRGLRGRGRGAATRAGAGQPQAGNRPDHEVPEREHSWSHNKNDRR